MMKEFLKLSIQEDKKSEDYLPFKDMMAMEEEKKGETNDLNGSLADPSW